MKESRMVVVRVDFEELFEEIENYGRKGIRGHGTVGSD